MKIALTGNPNSGKTTMYNALTGCNEKVGNWAGVTVDKKEHSLKKTYNTHGEQIIVVDLPGAYSMSPFTSEESITSSYVKNENPDVIVNIVDATTLNRSLFFTTQLLELGIPVVIALNKSDINQKTDTAIDVDKLALRLGCPVINTISTSGAGLQSIIDTAIASCGKAPKAPFISGDIDLDDRAAVEEADRKRFQFVNALVKEVETREKDVTAQSLNDKLDALLTNRWLGIPIFAVVMFLVFQISQVWIGTPIADWLVGGIEAFHSYMSELFADANPLLTALLIDGIIGGVGAVVGFLPLVMVLYFLISLLEDCGYMARVSVVLDPIFKKVGLSGKSVIPFVIGIGCAVPGVMACRTLQNERERRATVMLTPMIPCGAKIPVISLFAGAFFEDAGWVSTLMYFTGIILIFLGALIINTIAGYKAKHSFFIIELPAYKIPSVRNAFYSMCSRGWAYIVKASTIILLCNTAVQIMQTFDWHFAVAATADSSILATIAKPFAYLLAPIVGVVSWRLAAAVVTGFIAKENVVGTLAVCFVGLENLIDTENLAMLEGSGTEVAGILALTKIAALSYLMFNLYTPPCFAALGAMRSEMQSRKWFWAGIGFMLGTGYTASYLIYTIGTLITAPATLHTGSALAGLMVVILFIGILLSMMIHSNHKTKTELALEGNVA